METTDLLNIIKDCAYEVRKNLAQGYLESVYRRALMIELKAQGLKAMEEMPISVCYKGTSIGEFRADVVVEDKVIIELKAVREVSPVHEIQLVNYLTTTGIDHGFLINYGGPQYRIIYKTRLYEKL